MRGLHPAEPRKLEVTKSDFHNVMGQKRTLKHVGLMSALPPKADIAGRQLDVCFVPKADIRSWTSRFCDS
jgi:hypothetical protein